MESAVIRHALALLEKWTIWASATVVLGVLLEAVAEALRHDPAKRWLSHLGVWVVLTGVSAETLILLLSQHKIEEYRQVEDAQTVRANARADSAYLLGKKAAQESLAHQIVEHLAPRRLTAEQQARIARELKLSRQRIDVTLTVVTDEVRGVGDQIESALSRAGWWLQEVLSPGMLPTRGMLVRTDSTPPYRQAAESLVSVLRGCNLAVDGPITMDSLILGSPEESHIILFIGEK